MHKNFMWQCALRHLLTIPSISAPCGLIKACEDFFDSTQSQELKSEFCSVFLDTQLTEGLQD